MTLVLSADNFKTPSINNLYLRPCSGVPPGLPSQLKTAALTDNHDCEYFRKRKTIGDSVVVVRPATVFRTMGKHVF